MHSIFDEDFASDDPFQKFAFGKKSSVLESDIFLVAAFKLFLAERVAFLVAFFSFAACFLAARKQAGFRRCAMKEPKKLGTI